MRSRLEKIYRYYIVRGTMAHNYIILLFIIYCTNGNIRITRPTESQSVLVYTKPNNIIIYYTHTQMYIIILL